MLTSGVVFLYTLFTVLFVFQRFTYLYFKISTMKYIFMLSGFFFVLTACNQASPEKISLPDPPAGAEQFSTLVTGKTFSVQKAGTFSAFRFDESKEKQATWLDPKKDTSRFLRDFQDQIGKFQLAFRTSDSLEFEMEGKMINAGWQAVDMTDEKGNKETQLKVSYPTAGFSFGQTGNAEPMIMTITYKVLGADNKQLFLETNRTLNRNQVVVLMEAK